MCRLFKHLHSRDALHTFHASTSPPMTYESPRGVSGLHFGATHRCFVLHELGQSTFEGSQNDEVHPSGSQGYPLRPRLDLRSVNIRGCVPRRIGVSHSSSWTKKDGLMHAGLAQTTLMSSVTDTFRPLLRGKPITITTHKARSMIFINGMSPDNIGKKTPMSGTKRFPDVARQ